MRIENRYINTDKRNDSITICDEINGVGSRVCVCVHPVASGMWTPHVSLEFLLVRSNTKVKTHKRAVFIVHISSRNAEPTNAIGGQFLFCRLGTKDLSRSFDRSLADLYGPQNDVQSSLPYVPHV